MFPSKNDLIGVLQVLPFLVIAIIMLEHRPAAKTGFPAHSKQVEEEISLACVTQDTHEDLCPNLHEWMERVNALDLPLEVK